MDLINFLSYGFVQRALITGCCIAVLCSMLGVFLVLRRLSLIGDGLAHVTFGAIALGLVLHVYPLYISIPIVMACSLWIIRLSERARLYGDAAIGIVSSAGIAGGTMLASIAGGFNVDLFSYLFGNILAISAAEAGVSMGLALAVILTILTFYQELLSITFDEEFARTSGIKTKRINAVFLLATALTLVLATRIVGILLVSSLLILPAVTSLQIARGFKAALIISCLAGVMSVIAGTAVSFAMNLPTGATIVMLNLLFFITACMYRGRTD
jgi:zinc transport system permease protein